MKIIDAIPPIHPEGYVFIICGAAFAFLSGAFFPPLGWLAFLTTIFIACFFRDPKRVVPQGEDLVVSPADGVVDSIEDAYAPSELNDEATYKRVSIFLSVFNVHVNRVPASGVITDLHYRKGKFLNASMDKASIDNERQSCVMQTGNGNKIVFVQIAGLIARRIICSLNEKQNVIAGDKFGIIRFGSRVDLYLPKDTKINVSVGQTMVGGETIIANLQKIAKPVQVKKKAVKTKAKKSV
jgi:phosphatidylserine decarboxylase